MKNKTEARRSNAELEPREFYVRRIRDLIEQADARQLDLIYRFVSRFLRPCA